MVRLMTRRISRPARRACCALLIALSGISLSRASTAWGQQYTAAARVVKNLNEAKALRKTVDTLIRSGGGSFSAADETQLKKYYLGYIAIEMTQTENINGTRYPEWRREIVRDIAAAGSAQKQAAIRNIILLNFKKLVEDKTRSPACRYNALLTIGELNEREQDRRTKQPPVPSDAGREVLLSVYNDPTETEAMKIGALVGLARHNKMLVGGGQTNAEILAVFRKVMSIAEPGTGGSADGLEWMKLLAIDALGDAGLAEDATLLAPVLQDEKAPELLRMAAYKSLGRLQFKNTDEIDELAIMQAAASLTTKMLGQQVTETKLYIENNADEIRNMQRMTPVDGGGTGGAGGTGGTEPGTGTARTGTGRPVTPAVPEIPYVARVRQATRYQLKIAELMLEAITPAFTDPTANSARSSLSSELTSLLKALDTTTLMPQEFLDKLTPSHARLEGIVSTLSK